MVTTKAMAESNPLAIEQPTTIFTHENIKKIMAIIAKIIAKTRIIEISLLDICFYVIEISSNQKIRLPR